MRFVHWALGLRWPDERSGHWANRPCWICPVYSLFAGHRIDLYGFVDGYWMDLNYASSIAPFPHSVSDSTTDSTAWACHLRVGLNLSWCEMKILFSKFPTENLLWKSNLSAMFCVWTRWDDTGSGIVESKWIIQFDSMNVRDANNIINMINLQYGRSCCRISSSTNTNMHFCKIGKVSHAIFRSSHSVIGTAFPAITRPETFNNNTHTQSDAHDPTNTPEPSKACSF